MNKFKCIHCGTVIQEIKCIKLSLENDHIIAEKVGGCPNCEAEYSWEEKYTYSESYGLEWY